MIPTYDPMAKPRRAASAPTLLATALLFASALPLAAEDAHQHHRHMLAAGASREVEAQSKMTIPDTALIDQDGNEVRFYSDLIQDRVVAMNFRR